MNLLILSFYIILNRYYVTAYYSSYDSITPLTQNQPINITEITSFLLADASYQEKEQFTNYFNRYFNLNAIRLVYPKSMAKFQQLKRCVLGTFLRYPYFHGSTTKYQQIAIKLEKMSNVRAKYDYKANKINCDKSSTGIPVESYIASLMQNQPYFVKYHSISHTFYFRNNLTINMYVYDKIDNAKNLQDWIIHYKRTKSNQEIELKLSKWFLQMHRALITLLNWGYAYTDFKPENVLIDEQNDKAYLIDLESVASANTKTVCLRTVAFTPPLYQQNRLVNIDALSDSKSFYQSFNQQPGQIHDRMMTWTFCYSIYALLCTKTPKDVFVSSFRREKFAQWSSGRDDQKFTDIFKCPNGSNKLINLLNSCLFKEQKYLLFRDLIKNNWFNS
jgi:hypothetical protein